MATNEAQQVSDYGIVKHSWKESLTSQIIAQVPQQQQSPDWNQSEVGSCVFMGPTLFYLMMPGKKSLHIRKTAAGFPKQSLLRGEVLALGS